MQEQRWVVHKFGGSSLADADCLRRVAAIVEALPESRVALVLSACRGVTDELIELVGVAERADEAGCEVVLSRLHQRHEDIATALLAPPARDAFVRQLQADIADLRRLTHTVALVRPAGRDLQDLAAGFGELWSSRLFAAFLENRERRGAVRWIDSRDIVVVEWGALGPSSWKLEFDGRAISLKPPIDNWTLDCGSHYRIKQNRVRWLARWSQLQVEVGRA